MQAAIIFVELYPDVTLLAGLALACLAVSVAAGLADTGRSRRTNLDRVGFMPWRTLSIICLFVAASLAYLAWKDWMGG
ncbi:MAG: hypothetical protein AB7U34_05440 [Novosphingobium sp.]